MVKDVEEPDEKVTPERIEEIVKNYKVSKLAAEQKAAALDGKQSADEAAKDEATATSAKSLPAPVPVPLAKEDKAAQIPRYTLHPSIVRMREDNQRRLQRQKQQSQQIAEIKFPSVPNSLPI